MGSGGSRDAGGGYGAYMRAVSLHQKGGGFPEKPGEDIPQPGAPGKATISGHMGNQQTEGRGVPSG